MDDIIYASASGSTQAAISVVRISGKGAHDLVKHLARGTLPKLRVASLRRLVDPQDQTIIDQALVLLFAEGASYTGEESAELHIHGGEAVSAALSGALERLGARMARPGEFSRRALQSGALDLAQAEAVGALIAAETQIERRQALRGLEGEVGVLAERWRETLISLIGLLETGVDFVEEALGDDLFDEVRVRLEVFRTELSLHIEESERIELRRDRPIIALIGPPNAGKSSLLNAIAGLKRSIVSSTPGTTRDVVDLTIRVAGREIVLADTAGIRSTVDEIEREGVARSEEVMGRADRRLFVVSADTWEAFSPLIPMIEPVDAVFWTKTDLSLPSEAQRTVAPMAVFETVSANEPLQARRALESFLLMDKTIDSPPASPLIGSARRIALLEACDRRLECASNRLLDGSIELAIEELRKAAADIAAMTGRIDQEQVLDALFSRFCIGK